MDFLNFDDKSDWELYQEIETVPCCTSKVCTICSSYGQLNMDIFFPVEQLDNTYLTPEILQNENPEIPEIIRNNPEMEIIIQDDTFDDFDEKNVSNPKEDDDSFSNYSTSSSSDFEEEIVKKKKPKREQNRKSPNIAHWLRDLLSNPAHSDIIEWTHNPGEFKVVDQKQLAKLWGTRDRKKAKKGPMTYSNLARAIRYHYDRSKGKELELVRKKMVYRFSNRFMKSFPKKN